MTQVAIQVSNREKADLLVELLSSIDFVEQVSIDDDNIVVNNGMEIESIEPYIGPEYPQMLMEEAAFEQLLPRLKQQYSNQFVAIHEQQVIDHDIDELKLVERIDMDYPDQVVLIRQVLDVPESPLFFRSPRFVR